VARALYLGPTAYRIHGTNQLSTMASASRLTLETSRRGSYAAGLLAGQSKPSSSVKGYVFAALHDQIGHSMDVAPTAVTPERLASSSLGLIVVRVLAGGPQLDDIPHLGSCEPELVARLFLTRMNLSRHLAALPVKHHARDR
jgi:hypothetical protein